MATSIVTLPPARPSVVSDFITDLRSQYVISTPTGTQTNWSNVAKDTFNSGVIGMGYGAAEAIAARPVAPYYSTSAMRTVDFNPSNVQAARVIRGLGQALGCVVDVAEAGGNYAQGNNVAAVCNIASCAGGVAGGYGLAALGSTVGPATGFLGGAFGGYLGGKVAEYACKQYFGLPTGSTPLLTSIDLSHSSSGNAISPKLTIGISPPAANQATPLPASPEVSSQGQVKGSSAPNKNLLKVPKANEILKESPKSIAGLNLKCAALNPLQINEIFLHAQQTGQVSPTLVQSNPAFSHAKLCRPVIHLASGGLVMELMLDQKKSPPPPLRTEAAFY